MPYNKQPRAAQLQLEHLGEIRPQMHRFAIGSAEGNALRLDGVGCI
jgi:hypothetical protein